MVERNAASILALVAAGGAKSDEGEKVASTVAKNSEFGNDEGGRVAATASSSMA